MGFINGTSHGEHPDPIEGRHDPSDSLGIVLLLCDGGYENSRCIGYSPLPPEIKNSSHIRHARISSLNYTPSDLRSIQSNPMRT